MTIIQLQDIKLCYYIIMNNTIMIMGLLGVVVFAMNYYNRVDNVGVFVNKKETIVEPVEEFIETKPPKQKVLLPVPATPPIRNNKFKNTNFTKVKDPVENMYSRIGTFIAKGVTYVRKDNKKIIHDEL